MLAFGLVLLVLALGVAGALLLTRPRVAVDRRSVDTAAPRRSTAAASEALVRVVDSVMRRQGWAPFSAQELYAAGVSATPSVIMTTILLTMFSLATLVVVVGGTALAALVAAAAVPVAVKGGLVLRANKRRAAFASQLEMSLELVASGLRSGHSMVRALDTVSRQSEAPMATECARIVNENRLGRDLVTAMEDTADRMRSEDFRWIAEAVGIHRQSGGNLNEVLDRVAETLRERSAIREKIRSLSSEGVYSAIVIMAVPVFVIAVYTVTNRTYAAILFTTAAGIKAIVLGLVLYAIGGLWMRSLIRMKV